MKVEIVPYNPEWKKKYTEEAEVIRKACGEKILTMEHLGSTSIEGLAAKPVIDMWVGTKTLEDANGMVQKMQSIGYDYINKYETELPFRRFFKKDIDGKRAYQVHALPASHPFWRDDFLFRDYLKVKETVRKDYEKLKFELSQKEWKDSNEYADAKSEFVKKVKDEALKYFGDLYEKAESESTYLMHVNASEESCRKAGFSMLREGDVTAIRTDIFPGFSLNHVLGISEVNEDLLDRLENFYKGKPGKFSLNIPPDVLNDEKKEMLKARGYSYANSYVTFYRHSGPVTSRGTEFEVKEIGKEHAEKLGWIIDEVFSFPHEFDDVIASCAGRKEWKHYIAFDGEKPAGSGSLCFTAAGSYLAFGAVIPQYRRKGIQGELLARRINAAGEAGTRWIFVDTSENSEEHPNPSYWNMLRYGFALLYYRPNYVKEQ